MGHQPERTCIGCRGVFTKEDVVRIVSGQAAVVIDYREKLPGRAAYVCPRRECIQKALGREVLSRAFRRTVVVPSVDEFIAMLASGIAGKIKALIQMSAKAGRLSAGYSAVRDALEKDAVKMIIYAGDLSDGTKDKIGPAGARVRQTTLFNRDEMGRMLGREMVGVVGIEDKGFADAVWKETERLKVLININE